MFKYNGINKKEFAKQKRQDTLTNRLIEHQILSKSYFTVRYFCLLIYFNMFYVFLIADILNH